MKSSTDKKALSEKEYDRAISLMQYQTELLWKEFEAFLLAETVLIGFLGTALTQDGIIIGKNPLVFWGAILGILLCIPWWSTFWHNYGFYLLRMAQAKRHEVALGIVLLTEGEKLSLGDEVEIGDMKIRHSLSARLLPPRYAVRWLIILFGLAFFMLIIITGHWCR